jgi:hypothetical protein
LLTLSWARLIDLAFIRGHSSVETWSMAAQAATSEPEILTPLEKALSINSDAQVEIKCEAYKLSLADSGRASGRGRLKSSLPVEESQWEPRSGACLRRAAGCAGRCRSRVSASASLLSVSPQMILLKVNHGRIATPNCRQ